ncbi:MAG TPA: hypothetical protein VFT53_02735 [Candidatus Saccharimonadales bacterium]|nr:hypothetical protein [Candidatus Saccharimonadales bacterium]
MSTFGQEVKKAWQDVQPLVQQPGGEQMVFSVVGADGSEMPIQDVVADAARDVMERGGVYSSPEMAAVTAAIVEQTLGNLATNGARIEFSTGTQSEGVIPVTPAHE